MVFLDTHIVMWLGMGDLKRLSILARRLIVRQPVNISPFVRLELGFLYEMGKLKNRPEEFFSDVVRDLEAVIHEQPLVSIVAEAEKLSWTRDPFDRLIVGHALAAEAVLVTKDDLILANCKSARW